VPEPGVTSPDDRLRTVGDLELDQDVGDIVTDRLLAEPQPGRDDRIGTALGDLFKNLTFALGQLRKDGRNRGRADGEVGKDAGGEPGAENRLSRGDRPPGSPAPRSTAADASCITGPVAVIPLITPPDRARRNVLSVPIDPR
jgi:hypothetical protein